MARASAGERKGVSISLTDAFDAAAWLLFSGVASKLARKLRLEEVFRRAALATHPHIYMARALFSTLLVGLESLAFVALSIALSQSMKTILVTVLFSVIATIAVFLAYLVYPYTKVSERKKVVEDELPFFAAYLTTMTFGGVPADRVFERLAQLKIFKGIRREAERIVRDMKLFGMDPLTAIDNVVKHHPSQLFRDFLLGYTTTIRTGGDVLHYLEIRTRDIFRAKVEGLRSIAERIGLIVELFITFNVVLALSLYVFFVVSSVISVGGTPLPLFLLFTLVIQPLVSAIILVVVDSMLPKYGRAGRIEIGYMVIAVPIAIVVAIGFFVALGGYTFAVEGLRTRHIVLTTLSITVGLSIISCVGTKLYLDRVRSECGILENLSNFLRDLTETRKTGLSVERCIIYLSTSRSYGTLTDIVRRIAGALLVGVDIIEATRRALRGIRNWFVVTIFRFLVDAIEFGGATPQILEMITHFSNELIAMFQELRRRLRTYIAVPYIGSLMLSMVSLMVLGMLVSSAQHVLTGIGAASTATTVAGGMIRLRISPEDVATIALAISVSCAINAWISGLLCGKLRSLTILEGFVHGLALLWIAATAATLALTVWISPLVGW